MISQNELLEHLRQCRKEELEWRESQAKQEREWRKEDFRAAMMNLIVAAVLGLVVGATLLMVGSKLSCMQQRKPTVSVGP